LAKANPVTSNYNVEVHHDHHQIPLGKQIYKPIVEKLQEHFLNEHHDNHHHDGEDYHSYPKYKFEYGVKDPHTGAYKQQEF
jgi:hypothetical protein